MVSLVVEASNGFCSIACIENKNILAEKNLECKNNLSVVILSEIDNCLKAANKTKSDLTEIISSEGPGSYTAIRVVAAVCKTMAFTLKLPLKVVSSLKLLALLEFNSNKLIVHLIDARRGNVFSAVYKKTNNELSVVKEEGYYSLGELNEFLESEGKDFIYVGQDIKKLKEKLLDAEYNESPVRSGNIIEIYNTLEIKDFYNMKPKYLRKTEAERELENDKNK